MATVASTSSAPATKFSLKNIFSRVFTKKPSKNQLRVSELEAKVQKYKTALKAEQDRNDCFTIENQQLRDELKACKQQLNEKKIASEYQSENYLGLIEKLTKEKLVMVSELEHDKVQLISQLQTANQKLTELQNAHSEFEKIQNFNDSVKELEQERKVLNIIRKKNEELTKKHMKKEVEKNGEEFPWQSCEICMEKYSHKEETSPRILACGHTVCLSCTKRLSEENVIKCPFDRIGTQYNGKIGDELPKNYAVLKMC
ncbi:hypothetical protein CAEBREN_12155 [Caenorhabditis brenneri]|uniref:RING-type domain-containing protein n=1 Tax=Caenorhabditis brenneri TaxID=135651 RepID=G0MUL1_CAEBE|nr:hypothetical protein CAEBREN_12155 [Caenorhabditis brenneri]